MKKNKILLIITAILVILLVFLLIFNNKYENNKNINISDDGYIITIEKDDTVSSVIEQLHNDGVIESVFFTKIYLKTTGLNYTIIDGTYEFKKGDDLDFIFDSFSKGPKQEIVVFTSYEGETLDETASRLAVALRDENYKQQIVEYWDSPDFVNAAIASYEIITEEVLDPQIYHPLEGYFSPNTYYIDVDSFKIEYLDYISNILLDQRQTEFVSDFGTDGAYNEYLKTPHDVITLASIVEREALTYEDRQMVAGVFMNRLAAGDRLGSDVTTYYGSNIPMSSNVDLTREQLDDPNPYNTRGSVYGLPIGPVNNPSNDSIDATIHYIPSDYYYFVSDKNGELYFTKNFEEHSNLIKRLKEEGLWFYAD